VWGGARELKALVYIIVCKRSIKEEVPKGESILY
jgi:hypothetical protein